jgi:hypothetical protein
MQFLVQYIVVPRIVNPTKGVVQRLLIKESPQIVVRRRKVDLDIRSYIVQSYVFFINLLPLFEGAQKK